jgi:hypothetical protein
MSKLTLEEHLMNEGFYGRNINSPDFNVYGQKKSLAAPAESDKTDEEKKTDKKAEKKPERKNDPAQKLSTYLSIASSIQ